MRPTAFDPIEEIAPLPAPQRLRLARDVAARFLQTPSRRAELERELRRSRERAIQVIGQHDESAGLVDRLHALCWRLGAYEDTWRLYGAHARGQIRAAGLRAGEGEVAVNRRLANLDVRFWMSFMMLAEVCDRAGVARTEFQQVVKGVGRAVRKVSQLHGGWDAYARDPRLRTESVKDAIRRRRLIEHALRRRPGDVEDVKDTAHLLRKYVGLPVGQKQIRQLLHRARRSPGLLSSETGAEVGHGSGAALEVSIVGECGRYTGPDLSARGDVGVLDGLEALLGIAALQALSTADRHVLEVLAERGPECSREVAEEVARRLGRESLSRQAVDKRLRKIRETLRPFAEAEGLLQRQERPS